MNRRRSDKYYSTPRQHAFKTVLIWVCNFASSVVIALMLLLLVISVAEANGCTTDTECEATLPDYRVGMMPHSKHFNDRPDDDDDWNETHHGVFVEYRLNEPGDWVGAMVYENSIDNTSVAVYGINDAFFTRGKMIDAGLVYGLVTGYDWALVPYVLPTISVKAGHFRARTIVFPIGVATQFSIEF